MCLLGCRQRSQETLAVHIPGTGASVCVRTSVGGAKKLLAQWSWGLGGKVDWEHKGAQTPPQCG